MMNRLTTKDLLHIVLNILSTVMVLSTIKWKPLTQFIRPDVSCRPGEMYQYIILLNMTVHNLCVVKQFAKT